MNTIKFNILFTALETSPSKLARETGISRSLISQMINDLKPQEPTRQAIALHLGEKLAEAICPGEYKIVLVNGEQADERKPKPASKKRKASKDN